MGVIQFDAGRPQIVRWTALGSESPRPHCCAFALSCSTVWFCIMMFHSVVRFCVVLYNVLCGVVHSWPELATQLSLNYQIIPHIPRDHTGHLSLQATHNHHHTVINRYSDFNLIIIEISLGALQTLTSSWRYCCLTLSFATFASSGRVTQA